MRSLGIILKQYLFIAVIL